MVLRTAADYRQALQKLLPPGLAWTLEPNATLTKLLEGFADEPERIDQRASDLVDEADPRTTSELLPDWERVLGFPDACIGVLEGETARRQALVERLTNAGGQSPGYYIAVALDLGFTVTVEEHDPFIAGHATEDRGSRAGDALTNDPWIFTWTLHVQPDAVIEFRAGQGAAGDPLRSWDNDLLECVMERIRPAHTFVRFLYDLGVYAQDPATVTLLGVQHSRL